MPFLMTSLGYIRYCVFMQQIEGFPLVWCMKSATVELISLKLNLWTRFDNLIEEDTKWQSYHCISEKDYCILMPSLKVSRRRYIPSKSKTKCLVFYTLKKNPDTSHKFSALDFCDTVYMQASPSTLKLLEFVYHSALWFTTGHFLA